MTEVQLSSNPRMNGSISLYFLNLEEKKWPHSHWKGLGGFFQKLHFSHQCIKLNKKDELYNLSRGHF